MNESQRSLPRATTARDQHQCVLWCALKTRYINTSIILKSNDKNRLLNPKRRKKLINSLLQFNRSLILNTNGRRWAKQWKKESNFLAKKRKVEKNVKYFSVNFVFQSLTSHEMRLLFHSLFRFSFSLWWIAFYTFL